MTDVETFLNQTVPGILLKLQSNNPFFVVGTRAINAYLSINNNSLDDWDIAYVGDTSAQESFSEKIVEIMQNLGYNIGIEILESYGDDNETFAFNSRTRIRLSVNIGDANIFFLDIYRLPSQSTGVSTKINGLYYSDMGFLIRELNRKENDVKKLIKQSSNFTRQEIHNKYKNIQSLLDDSAIDLNIIDFGTDDLIEDFGRISDKVYRNILSEQEEQLESARATLEKTVKNRDIIFGYIASGKSPKEMVTKVCKICREFEDQYVQYKNLKERCESIRKLC